MRKYKTYVFRGQEQLTKMAVNRITDTLNGGVTVEELSHVSGVSQAAIYNWLNGDTTSATVPCLRAVLRALGADITFTHTGKAAIKVQKEFE